MAEPAFGLTSFMLVFAVPCTVANSVEVVGRVVVP
jgi:hypothetical protein